MQCRFNGMRWSGLGWLSGNNMCAGDRHPAMPWFYTHYHYGTTTQLQETFGMRRRVCISWTHHRNLNLGCIYGSFYLFKQGKLGSYVACSNMWLTTKHFVASNVITSVPTGRVCLAGGLFNFYMDVWINA